MNTLLLPDVLKSIHNLPSLPAVVVDLIASMQDPDVDIDVLARKISLDQALTAKTLRIANSSFYGLQRQVTTVGEAIAILGFQSVQTLATTAALMASVPAGGSGAFNLESFWRHAVGTAACARALARPLKVNAEQAYLSGLLHDIGRLVLATRFPDHYAAVAAHRVRTDCTMLAAERALLGLDHAAIGEALARHWKFPESTQQAVARHHTPGLLDTDPMALLIHAADAMAHALDFSMEEDDQVPSLTDATWNQLGLDEPALAKVFREADVQFQAASGLLKP